MGFILFFHLLGLLLGAGAGLGHMAVAIAHKKTGGGPPNDTIKAIKPVLGMLGLAGILLLWLTGIIMLRGYDTSALGIAFYVKLSAAGIMLLITLWLTYVAGKAAKAGVPPPAYMDNLGRMNMPLALIALGLAIYIFS